MAIAASQPAARNGATVVAPLVTSAGSSKISRCPRPSTAATQARAMAHTSNANAVAGRYCRARLGRATVRWFPPTDRVVNAAPLLDLVSSKAHDRRGVRPARLGQSREDLR